MKQPLTTALLACFVTLGATAQDHLMLPYSTDFENGMAGWATWDNNNGTEWQLGIPTFGFTPAAHSGDYCWDVNLNTSYMNNGECHLYSPLFDFTYVPVARISFWTIFHAEYLWDYLTVQYTIDNGDSWLYLPFPNLIHPDGQLDRWTESALIVNSFYGYPEVQFRFVFISDGNVVYDGYSIDDFRIDPLPTGTSDPALSSFSVYPNPARDFVEVTTPATANHGSTLTLFDLSGREVQNVLCSGITQQRLSLSSVEKGLYLVVYNDGETTQVKRLVVE